MIGVIGTNLANYETPPRDINQDSIRMLGYNGIYHQKCDISWKWMKMGYWAGFKQPFFWEILGDFRKFHWDDLFLLLRWCSMGFKVYITNWTITMLLMGESTISMSIFSSYVSLPEASYNGMWFEYYGDMMLIVHGIPTDGQIG